MARLVKRPEREEILDFCAEDPIERVFLEDVARQHGAAEAYDYTTALETVAWLLVFVVGL